VVLRGERSSNAPDLLDYLKGLMKVIHAKHGKSDDSHSLGNEWYPDRKERGRISGYRN